MLINEQAKENKLAALIQTAKAQRPLCIQRMLRRYNRKNWSAFNLPIVLVFGFGILP